MEQQDGVRMVTFAYPALGKKQTNKNNIQNEQEKLADGRRQYPILAEIRADSKFSLVQ